MRCVAGVGLVLLVGCNQIFGLAPAGTYDAAIELPHAVVTWQLATPLPSGAPDPALSYPAFAPGRAPPIRIATLDGPFAPAEYQSSQGREGWVAFPSSYLGTTWRLEYTLPGDVPREVQWAPEELGHLVVPMVGRRDRESVPTGSGYTITPTNSASYTFPHVFTTGLWTDGPVTEPPTGSTVNYGFSSAESLSGPRGRPDPAQGDRALLVDYIVDGSQCRVAVGSAPFDAALQPSVRTAKSAVWDTARKRVLSPPIDTAVLDRLTTDPLHGTFRASLSVQLYGMVASPSFPGLTGTSSSLSPLALPVPVMVTLLQCPFSVNPLPDTTQPVMFSDFPRVLHVQLVASRPVLGVNLLSGLETVIAAPETAGAKVAFPAPLATRMTLATPSGAVDLAGASDQVAIGAPAGSYTLSFVPEAGADLRADYHDVLLHRITGGALTTERIFTVTTPRVRIDGSLLIPGADYVLEIRSYKGHAMAPRGDFAPVDYPYGAAIVFTRTFKTS